MINRGMEGLPDLQDAARVVPLAAGLIGQHPGHYHRVISVGDPSDGVHPACQGHQKGRKNILAVGVSIEVICFVGLWEALALTGPPALSRHNLWW